MRRCVLSLLAVLAFAATAAPAHAGGDPASCPAGSVLVYANTVYVGEPAEAAVPLEKGELLGKGEVDRPIEGPVEGPIGDDPCKHERVEIDVFAIAGVPPGLAVYADDGGLGFILGGRCTGLEGSERWDCVRSPLVFDGVDYTAVRYPAEPAPQGKLELGEGLGEAAIGGENVAVLTIVGVDPAVAVAVEGRPTEAFVAPGACPYEVFANQVAADDLLRCLRAPTWFVIAPPGGEPGDPLAGASDRVTPEALEGATVGLVKLEVAADVLPDPVGQITQVGVVSRDADGRVSLDFAVPEVDAGIYELVVRCERCADAFGGETDFPAGSILVLESGSGGSASAKVVYLAVFAILILLIVAAAVYWRRGRLRRRRAAG